MSENVEIESQKGIRHNGFLISSLAFDILNIVGFDCCYVTQKCVRSESSVDNTNRELGWRTLISISIALVLLSAKIIQSDRNIFHFLFGVVFHSSCSCSVLATLFSWKRWYLVGFYFCYVSCCFFNVFSV